MTISITYDEASKKFVGKVKDRVVARSQCRRYVEERLNAATGTVNDFSAPTEAPVASKFTINERFGFVEKLVRMVAESVQPSAVITGEGGLGKTYTVTKTLKACGYSDLSGVARAEVVAEDGTTTLAPTPPNSFVTVKGYSSAKGLFRTLYQNKNSVVVFDDCDAVLKDPVALNVLKGALDSYGERRISWNADIRDADLPRSFNFEGRIIFISNMTQDRIDQAIRSRSMMIDLSMSLDQKIERMGFIAKSPEFMPEYSTSIKTDALALIRANKTAAKEISLRTLIAVAKIRSANKDWKDLATYIITS